MQKISKRAAYVIGPFGQKKDEVIVSGTPAQLDRLITEAPEHATHIYFYDILSEIDPWTRTRYNSVCNFSERLPLPQLAAAS